MLSYKIGIWSRLLLAFSCIAGLTVLVGLTALLIFYRSQELVGQLAETHIPELVQVSRFVKLGGEVIAVAPDIIFAREDADRAKVRQELDGLLVELERELKQLETEKPVLREAVKNLLTSLAENLQGLNRSVSRRNRLENQLNRITEKLRWLYSDLIDEVDPLNQDYAYNLDAELERIIERSRLREPDIHLEELQKIRSAKERIEKIRSSGVLLVGLMVQSVSVESLSQLINLSALAKDEVGLLQRDMQALAYDAAAITLRNVLEELSPLVEGEDSIFALRRQILEAERESRAILDRNRAFVAQFERIAQDIVTRSERQAARATQDTRESLLRAWSLLLAMVVGSVLIVAAVMWFYVRRNIVARLSALSRAMRAIARGDLTYPVPGGSPDEIGRMAIALRVFRDTAQAVEDANAQAIIDNTGVGLLLADPDGTVQFANPTFTELFRLGDRSFTGSSVYDIVTGEEKEAFRHDCAKLFMGEQSQPVLATRTGRRGDGTTFPVDIHIHLVSQRRTRRLLVTVHDVTEREQAQQLLRARVREKTEHLRLANLQLQEEISERRRIEDELVQAGKLAALGEFSAGIAHELNQPLSAIRYYLHNGAKLLDRGLTETHLENLARMEELVERMAKMLNHLKTFARLQPESLAEVDLGESLARALELLAGRIEEKGVDVMNDLPGTPLPVLADSGRLEQALTNVLSNGIDAAGANGPGKLQLDIVLRDETVCLRITDDGPGVEITPVDSIFDPFVTTKEVGRGLGLGLSIAYNMVKGFGGNIVAENLSGGGARFTITLRRGGNGIHDETDR